MMGVGNIHYEMAEKSRAVNCGGIGAIHLMVNKLGLRQEIDSRLHLLKKHLPYHESDHVQHWLERLDEHEAASSKRPRRAAK